MGGNQTVSQWDFDKEPTSVSIPTAQITDVNYVVQDGYMDDFTLAVAGVSTGFIFRDTRMMELDVIPGTPPATPDTQREKKWLVRMHDAVTGKAHTMEIGCADLSLLDTQARGQMDKTKSEWTDLKAAIEAMYLTDQGNAVVVDEAVFVGRNL